MKDELQTALAALEHAVFASPLLPQQLAREIFVVASIASGSSFCQAHGAIRVADDGGSIERIQALWDFERSPLFNDAERAVFRIVKASATVPSSLNLDQVSDVLKFWTKAQCKQMVAISCLAAWRQRRASFEIANLDEQSLKWARKHLGPVGWDFEPALPMATATHTVWRRK